MSINTDNTGIQPASDEAIRLRLLQELNKAYAEAPRMADYSVMVELASWGGNDGMALRWSMTAMGPDHCLVSPMVPTPQIASLNLGYKYQQQVKIA